jgi:hypothetical protein
LVEVAGNPILLYPKDDQIVIANELIFEWSYKSEQIPHFIIEITRFTPSGLKYATYSVLQPQNRIFHMPISGDGDVGQYLWRVRPGLLLEDHKVETGPWSAYQSFWVFTSVKQKIQQMRKMTVGMYPSFSDPAIEVTGPSRPPVAQQSRQPDNKEVLLTTSRYEGGKLVEVRLYPADCGIDGTRTVSKAGVPMTPSRWPVWRASHDGGHLKCPRQGPQ